ncbi:MAG: glycosyltransferase family 2 protein [Syntrophobacter sp.]
MSIKELDGTHPYPCLQAPAEIVVEIDRRRTLSEDIVTVTVSLYNYARFLTECLDSIRAQYYQQIELIVVDDASDNDDSLAVAKSWLTTNADRFVRVLLLRHLRNQGLAAARNTGFLHATGDAVFVIDADNAIYPRAIARLYETLRETGAGAAYSQLEFFGHERRLGSTDVWMSERFQSGNYVDAMALVSKLAWRNVGGYSHMWGWEDYDFWCKFIEMQIEAIYVPEILCRYRVHPTSMLRTETDSLLNEIIVAMSLRHPWLRLGI